MKDTAFYPAAKEAYEEAYEENKKEGSLLIGMAATAVLILGVYLFIKKLRNRKRHRGKTLNETIDEESLHSYALC